MRHSYRIISNLLTVNHDSTRPRLDLDLDLDVTRRDVTRRGGCGALQESLRTLLFPLE